MVVSRDDIPSILVVIVKWGHCAMWLPLKRLEAVASLRGLLKVGKSKRWTHDCARFVKIKLVNMTRERDEEKICVSDRNQTHDLPNTGWVICPLIYENSWRARSCDLILGHVGQFTLHISLLSSEFTIFIHLSLLCAICLSNFLTEKLQIDDVGLQKLDLILIGCCLHA